MSEPRAETQTIQRHPGRSAQWILEVQDDAGGRAVPIGVSPIIVGGAASADVSLDDPTASARHVELSALGSGVAVRDLRSRNGTYVGSARVSEAWAAPGTMITIGRSSLICRARGLDDADMSQSALEGVAGASSEMRRIAAQVRRLSRYAAPVLVTGESGSGKELVARALHFEGPRREYPFLPINVAAVPRELMESELFGHERGAFTGAHQRRAGAFAEARGGTLFLDEIGELPFELQPKLLRALDGYDLRRVGASGVSSTQVRVVAATNAALESLIADGEFRRDLYHRLEVFVIRVPPLRERPGDIAAIAIELLSRMQGDHGRRTLTSAAIARLAAHPWRSGNVRELRNALVRAADLAGDEGILDVLDIERGLGGVDETCERLSLSPNAAEELVKQHGGNLSAAARAARCPRTTFRKLLARTK
jgi:hypothetical protein